MMILKSYRWTYKWKKSVTDLPSENFKLRVWIIPCGDSPTAVIQQRVSLKPFCLTQANEWMILTIINVGASIQHESSQRLIAVKSFDKLLWKLKAFCVLLRTMNDNQMITNQMNFPSTIPSPKGSWAEESTPNQLKSFMNTVTLYTFCNGAGLTSPDTIGPYYIMPYLLYNQYATQAWL